MDGWDAENFNAMGKTYIILPTGKFETNYLEEVYYDLKVTRFELQVYKPSPALIDKSGKSSRPYIGQNFDPQYFDILENGWDHDHCEICSTKISAEEIDENQTIGYFNGGLWVCKSCYELILATDNISQRLSELPKIQNTRFQTLIKTIKSFLYRCFKRD